jgi:hypothetical protein
MKVDDRRCLFLIAISSVPPPWDIRSWGTPHAHRDDAKKRAERAYTKFAPRMKTTR